MDSDETGRQNASFLMRQITEMAIQFDTPASRRDCHIKREEDKSTGVQFNNGFGNYGLTIEIKGR